MTEEAAYKKAKADAANLQRCAYCGIIGAKIWMDPHHPAGRSFGNLLKFVWLHRQCHDFLHVNPAEATAEGFLIEGRNTNSPDV